MLQSLIPEHFFNQYQYHLQVVRWIANPVGFCFVDVLGREFETSRVWLFRQVSIASHILQVSFACPIIYSSTINGFAIYKNVQPNLD